MKHELSITWKKILISALAILAVAVMGIGTYVIIQMERNRPGAACDDVYYENETIQIIAHWKNYNKEYLTMRDAKTGKKLINRFRWFSYPDTSADSIRVICDWDYQRGYFNIYTGEMVITPQYSHAWNFSEGLAAVAKGNRVGFINRDGEEVIPCQFEAGEHSIHRLGFAFHDSLCVMTNERDQCGIINRKGEWVVEPQYDCIWQANTAGLRIFQNDGLYGLMDLYGNIVLPLQYESMWDQYGCFFVEKNGIRSALGYNLQIVKPFLVDRIESFTYYDNGEEYTTTYKKYHIGYYEGIIDENNCVIIPAIYTYVEMVSPNVFKVVSDKIDSWILLDNKGKEISVVVPK